ncbi:MAG: hypothetical protein DCE92_06500, partial [Alphaproteobacteria bacterium]
MEQAMTSDDNLKPRKPRSWGRIAWWVVAGLLVLWGIQAGVQSNLRLAIGFLVAAGLASPIGQAVLRHLLGKTAPKWVPGTLAIGIALAAIIASPAMEVPTAKEAAATEPTPSPPSPEDTLPGRITNQLQLVNILIRDDLNTQEGHRDDYETAVLRNELSQADDRGTLTFEALRAERQGRTVEDLVELMQRVSAYQAREFPRYRAGFTKQAYDTLWKDDIIVSARGDGNSTLRLRGYVFSANRNIAETHAGLVEGASRVRFKRIEFQAFEG